MEKEKKLCIMLRTGPYSNENITTVLKIIESASKKNIKIDLILYEDGVYNINKKLKLSENKSLIDRLEGLLCEKLQIHYCNACLIYRGENIENKIKCLNAAGIVTFAKIISDADRFIMFG